MSMASRAILSNFFEEQRTQNHPQYLSGLSRALFPTTFLEIAVYVHGDAFHGVNSYADEKDVNHNVCKDSQIVRDQTKALIIITGGLKRKKMSLIKDESSLRRPEISPENYFSLRRLSEYKPVPRFAVFREPKVTSGIKI